MEIRRSRDCFVAVTINNVSEEVETSQLIALIAASVGKTWEEDLKEAHRELAYALSGQNFGDVGSEAYASEQGLEMEVLVANIYRKLAGMKPSVTIPGSKN